MDNFVSLRVLLQNFDHSTRVLNSSTLSTNMSAIGSLVFCTVCGNLLDGSTGNENTILTCECCGAQNKGQRY